MKTKSNVLASFLAAAVLADGDYDEFKQDLVKEYVEDLELNNLEKEVEKAIDDMQKMSDDEYAETLEKEAAKVAANEKEGVLTLCLQILCSDALLTKVEMENFFDFADLLDIDEDRAGEILDEFVEDEDELIIEQ